jgi:hypothetical protein
VSLGRVRPPEWAALLAGALLLAALFLAWYGPQAGHGSVARGPAARPLTAWQAFSVADAILALLALSGPALLAAQAVRPSPALPLALGVVTIAAGAVALGVVVLGLLSRPGGTVAMAPAAGAWIALLAAAGLLAAGWWSMAAERSRGAPQPPVEVRPAPPAAA